MRPSIVFTIFAKELRDTLRDRRALFAAVILPILLHPLIFMFMGGVMASHEAERAALRPRVAVWGDVPAPVVAALATELKADVVDRRATRPTETEAEARRAIESGTAHLVLAADAGTAANFTGDATAVVELYYDELRSGSDAAYDRSKEVLSKLEKSEANARLVRHSLPASLDRPLDPVARNLTDKKRRAGDFAGGIIGFALFFVLIVSGMLPAIDLTAGEKERGTLQTLLCAPVRPLEIVAGKYLTVATFSIVGAAGNLSAMSFVLAREKVAARGALEFSVGAATFVKVFVAIVPMALLVAALMLVIAVFARSFREAQSYLTPIFIALLLPNFVAMMPGMDLTSATAFIPVVNLSLLVRGLFNGHATVQLYFLVLIANLAYAAMAVSLAARIFESEQVLLGGERPWRDVFGRGEVARRTPTPRDALLFSAILMVVAYYGMVLLTPRLNGIIATLAALEIGLMLVPALLWTTLRRNDLRETFSLRAPTARGLAGGVLLAAGTWAVATLVARAEMHFFPGAQAYSEQLEHLLGGGGAALLIAGALLPAIAEEACFRGVILSGLANSGSRTTAVLGSAIAFGIFHFNPYHMIIAGTIGLILGFATLETGSIYIGALIHLVNNALRLLTPNHPILNRLESTPALVIGCVLTALGLALVRNSRRR